MFVALVGAGVGAGVGIGVGTGVGCGVVAFVALRSERVVVTRGVRVGGSVRLAEGVSVMLGVLVLLPSAAASVARRSSASARRRNAGIEEEANCERAI